MSGENMWEVSVNPTYTDRAGVAYWNGPNWRITAGRDDGGWFHADIDPKEYLAVVGASFFRAGLAACDWARVPLSAQETPS